MHLMIVEPNRTDLMVLSRLASQFANVLISPFSDAGEALEACRGGACDLIVAEGATRELDGVAFVRAARAEPGCADLPILLVTNAQDSAQRRAAVEAGATDFLSRPFDPCEIAARIRNGLELRRARLGARDRAKELSDAVAEATRSIAERERELMLSLARAVEFRDGEGGPHVERVAALSREIGARLGLAGDALDDLYLAAPLHDIGKIEVPDAILGKPGALTLEERAIMQQHTQRGHAMLARCRAPLLRKAATIALSHHERFDGAGYPHGLRGQEIPLEARIVAVADVYDALTSRRPYKAPWEAGRARDYLKASAGAQFDPDCVAAFLEAEVRGPA